MKICSKCQRSLPESEFCKHAGRADGLSSICKECKNSARRKGPKAVIPDEKMRARYRKIRVNGKQMSLHRHIAEEMIGRPLEPGEVVHHINGNKLDNRPENLQVMKSASHSSFENTGREHSPETKHKVSASLIGNARRKGIPHTPEMREHLRQTSIAARKRKHWSTKQKEDNLHQLSAATPHAGAAEPGNIYSSAVYLPVEGSTW